MKFGNFMPLILLILILLVVSSCSCGGGEGYLEYVDEGNGFAISYPQDWAVLSQDDLPEGVLAAFEASSACGNFTSMCAVDTSSLKEGEDFGGWCEHVLMLFSANPSYTLIDHGNTTLNDMDAFQHVYTVKTSEGVLVYTMQLYVPSNSTVWVLSCGCGFECWGQYESAFETMLYSFRLID
jgi:hypothetical protein